MQIHICSKNKAKETIHIYYKTTKISRILEYNFVFALFQLHQGLMVMYFITVLQIITKFPLECIDRNISNILKHSYFKQTSKANQLSIFYILVTYKKGKVNIRNRA